MDLKEGKADIRRVLEADDDLNQAKINAVSGLIQHRQAMLEYELATGQTLENRDISLSKEQVAERTRRMMQVKKISEKQYQDYLGAVREVSEVK